MNAISMIRRFSGVSHGTNTATYSYLANSPLVDHIAFAHSSTAEMTMRYTNDFVNRLTGISSALNFAYQYNLAGQRISVTNGDGSYWVYQYDRLGQVTNGVKHWGNGAVVAGQQFGYGFDTIGNRTMALAGGDQNGANRRQAGYAANNLNEYTSRTVPGAADVIGMATNTAMVWVNQTAAYRSNNYFWLGTPVNNASAPVYQTVTTLAALTNGNATNAEYGVTNIGHVFVPRTPENFGYDWDGNLTNDGHWSYYWDGENRLVAMTNNAGIVAAGEYTLAFAYDYQGRRIQKLVCTNSGLAYVPEYTNRFLYDGWNLVAILNPNASIVAAMMWGTDLSRSAQGAGGVGGLLAENLAANGVHFVAYDGNGNVAGLVSASSRTVTANYEYGPFGEVIRATGPMAKVNPFMFSTKFYDWESGLYYYGHRYYNPSTGRWLSRDPMAEQDRAINLYQFSANDCINGIDVLGLLSGVFLKDVTSDNNLLNGSGFDYQYTLGGMDSKKQYAQDVYAEIKWKGTQSQTIVTTSGHTNWFVGVSGAVDDHSVNPWLWWHDFVKGKECAVRGTFTGYWSGKLYPATIAGVNGGGQTPGQGTCTSTGCAGHPPVQDPWPPSQKPPTELPPGPPIVPTPNGGSISIRHEFSGKFDPNGITEFNKPPQDNYK
jgi:RHS repeat-associated protein